MNMMITRVHTNEEMQEALSNMTTEDINTSVIKGFDTLTKRRISIVKKAIPKAFEETKKDKYLKSLINQLDFSSLKQIDAIMRGNHSVSKAERQLCGAIQPENLNLTAINLYVAMVKRVYIGTIERCSREYTIQELSTIANGLLTLNQELTTISSIDKDKKFFSAEKAMCTLTQVNKAVVDRISTEAQTTKEKLLAK